MHTPSSVLKSVIVTLIKIASGLVAFYLLIILLSISMNYLWDIKKYSHCKTYDFIRTAQATRIKTPNYIRISDLRNVRTALSVHFENTGMYPIITSGTSKERWDKLLTSLELKNVDDPCIERNPDYQYSYGSNSSGTDYVVRAVMNEEGMQGGTLLSEVYGIWCGESHNDREYCIGPLQ